VQTSLPAATSTDTLSFQVPSLGTLLAPPRAHPRSQEIEDRTIAWAHQHIVGSLVPTAADMDRYFTRGTLLFDQWFFPLGDFERMLDLAIINLLAYLIDDMADEPDTLGWDVGSADAIIDAIRPTLRAGKAPVNGPPLLIAVTAVLERITHRMPENRRQVFRDQYTAYFEERLTSVTSQPKYTDIPDVETAVRAHIATIGMAFAKFELEYAVGLDLTHELASHPALREMRDTMMRMCVLVNDLYSYRRDLFDGDATRNIIGVLQRTQGLSLQESVDVLCEMINEHEKRVCGLRADVAASKLGSRSDVRLYLETLELYAAANLYYHIIMPRYHGPSAPITWNGPTAATLTLLPDRTLIEPRHTN
jgi:hypothetical protein